MEAMKKIIVAERQAASLVTEALVYKTMLINQTKKRAEEEAASLINEAEALGKKQEAEANAKIAEIKEKLANDLREIEENIKKKTARKKDHLISQLIQEVTSSDRSR